MARKRPAPRSDQTARHAALTKLLRGVESPLVSAAVSGGVCLLRPRSVPDRVRYEGRRFLALVADALRTRADGVFAARVAEEARIGAFACGDADEARGVVDVWRAVLRSFAAGHADILPAAPLERTLDRIERMLPAAIADAAPRRTDIVVIGGSAGGLAALREVLGAFDANMPASFMIVLHTHETSPMMMPLVLSRITNLAISYPVDGGALCLGHAYVAPPGRHLSVDGSRLRLVASPPVRFSRPSVDVLFASAAASHGPRVMSLILSGTGRDGSDGTVAVRDGGGATCAQDPDGAEFPGMPSAAIATGAVQYLGSLRALRRLLPTIITGSRPPAVELAS